jgi:succinate dehydrogenase/fumarate reductase-like Fe-S protein
MNRKKLATYAFMARFYFGHHIGRLLRSRREPVENGLDKFLRNYREDHILPLTPEERAVFPSFQACISCGLCTAECVLTRPAGRIAADAPLDPRAIAISYSRAIPEFWAARDIVRRCQSCGLCEEVCPTGAPLKRMVRFMADKMAEEGSI